MKIHLGLLCIFSFLTLTIAGQNITDRKYYKDKYGGPEVDEKKAKVVELTIMNPDGSISFEIRDKKNNKLFKLRKYKNEEPIGIWQTLHSGELNYDFLLIYKESIDYSLPTYDLKEKNVKGEFSGKFEAPIFPQNDNNFLAFISTNLIYPEFALENGIQGTVYSQFKLDENGNVIELSVYKSENKILDKEVARIIRTSPKWIPAKIDGKQVPIFITMTTIFKLE
jgi:TonB family protein